MAKKKRQAKPEETRSDASSDQEQHVGQATEQHPRFVVVAPESDTQDELQHSAESDLTGQSRAVTVRRGHFATIRKILIVGIGAAAAVLLYGLVKSTIMPEGARPIHVRQRPPDSEVSTTDLTKEARQVPPDAKEGVSSTSDEAQEVGPEAQPAEPLSLRTAETLYQRKEYYKAFHAYEQLRQNLPETGEEGLFRDLLQLKMAFCMSKAGSVERAYSLFRAGAQSHSPIVRALSGQHQSFADMKQNQYLQARHAAYRAIALIDAADYKRDWAGPLERDCHVLAAEAITRELFSLCDMDGELVPELWSTDSDLDPFANLGEAEMRSLLTAGSEQLSKASLAPQIEQLQRQSTLPRWSIACNGLPIEEVLSKFATRAGVDIHWVCDAQRQPSPTTDSSVRQRPVTLYLTAATTRQFVMVAAGCVGLVARLDDDETVRVYDPSVYSALSEHMALLSEEAVSLWQAFLLRFGDDERVGNAHFALGLLQGQREQIAEAVAEYKLVASRFSRSHLAPLALLHSSKLKARLADWAGARSDLREIVEQYPDTELSNQAWLYLAEATMKAGLYDEAARLYGNVYNLGLSLEMQSAAAFGAAKCFYQIQDYENSAKWLAWYINLAKGQRRDDLYSAYLLLGKANMVLGRPRQACDAFKSALAGRLSEREYVETILALTKAYMQQGRFIEALDVLEGADSWRFSPKESVEMLALKSSIFRSMGLVDKALAAIGDRAQYTQDQQLKARICLELARCHIAKGQPALARRLLTQILLVVEPGPLAQEIGYELAGVCLELGQHYQAISICLQILDSGPPAQMRQKTLGLLSRAYRHQKNYDKALLALLGGQAGTSNANPSVNLQDQARQYQAPDEYDQR
jgi:tetratricopeptide (TPR) repeat protein